MLSFIKNLFGSKPSQVEALPAGTEAVMATTEQRYVGENEQGSVYETVVVAPDAVVPATTEQRYVGETEQGSVYETVVVVPDAVAPSWGTTPIPLVVEAPVVAPAKKPVKLKAAPKPKAPAKPRAPKAK